jgi:hypothetical protein
MARPAQTLLGWLDGKAKTGFMSNGPFKIDYSEAKDPYGNQYQIVKVDDKFYSTTVVCRRCQTTITSRATSRPDIILDGHACAPPIFEKHINWAFKLREFF